MAVAEYLESIVKLIGQHHKKLPTDFKYLCCEDFVLQNGQEYTAQALPDGIPPREIKQCFCNSFHLAIENDDLIYVEGFAVNLIPIAHAWCVDKTGKVIDTTWANPEECEYFGVPFKREYMLAATIERGCYGLIENWENGYPVLKLPKEEWKHEQHLVHG